ncbi:bro [Trichoplusia ni granulovirus LBIV-12]|jgi:hypothetical protein|uniref:Bro n=1 Tax=Trichoplusia ni granulovirus LBIV-12 TaxID=1916701 RepID=A0A1D8QL80_GVTN|nr:bro [Trichoplusia ni granulovirus LBIV-12]AOW41406.1 bro [Trichoplusia ni granulovirus LBIV-12]
MESSQEYNVNRLIASNSILCNTIGKLEKRISEAENRIHMLDTVVMDKDRQLDMLYHRMNELYNILRQKDEQIQALIGSKNNTEPIPVIKLSASQLVPLVKIPISTYPSTSKSFVNSNSLIPEVEMTDSTQDVPTDLKVRKDTNYSEANHKNEELNYENYTDKYKIPIICVTRTDNLIKAVTAQTIYVEALKKRSEIDLDSIVVEINCKQPQKLWDETMKVCHQKYKNKVKLLRKSLCFTSVRDAETFSDEIKHMYKNLKAWDCNKQFLLD